MFAREFLRHHWHTITIIVTAAALAGAVFALWHSLPPRRIVMATGPEGGTYYVVGERYRDALAREGIKVELRPTAGSVENLTLLRDSDSAVSVAFVQGGISAGTASGLESLGTLFYEPLWWFHRRDVEGVGVAGLIGRKISIGPEGSGTRALAFELIRRAGIEQQVGELLPLTPREAPTLMRIVFRGFRQRAVMLGDDKMAASLFGRDGSFGEGRHPKSPFASWLFRI